jgi:hypothetical protein
MSSTAILLPVLVLAGWTFLVLSLIPIVRVRAARQRQVTAADFRYGESSRVPPWVSLPNRNYMNLLEIPVLFYVVCLVLFVTGTASPLANALAWVYVGLRVIHSIVHLSYNHVLHRLGAFAASNVALLALWVLALVRLLALSV